MNDIDYTLVTAGGILLAYSIVIWIFAGKKYMRWYCRSFSLCNPDGYDKKTFKIIHVTTLMTFSCSVIGIGLFIDICKPQSLVICILAAIPLLQYILLLTVCKKKKVQKKSEE